MSKEITKDPTHKGNLPGRIQVARPDTINQVFLFAPPKKSES
jgi:hypothetical protein